jgi:hypothetical protein
VQLELPGGLAPSQGKSDGGAPVGVAAVLLQLVCAPLPADVREARRQALDAATREAKEALEEVRLPARSSTARCLRVPPRISLFAAAPASHPQRRSCADARGGAGGGVAARGGGGDRRGACVAQGAPPPAAPRPPAPRRVLEVGQRLLLRGVSD